MFDTHAHIFRQNVGIENARYIPDYSVSKEDFKERLKSCDFSGGVLIQPSFLGYDNSLLLEAVRGDSNLRGVIVLPFCTDKETLQKYAESGVVGVRLNLIGKDVQEVLENLKSDWAKSFLDSIQKLGWHVEVHREMCDISAVIESLLQFGIKVVIDHLGRPSVDKSQDKSNLGKNVLDGNISKGSQQGLNEILSLKVEGRLWFKISGFYRFGGSKEQNLALARLVYARLLEKFGGDRFVFGSDFPHTNFEDRVGYKEMLESFYKVVLDSKEQEAILGKNAKVLFGF